MKKKQKNYCVICAKYRRFRNPKISSICEKVLVLSIICSNCENKDEKVFKEKRIHGDFKSSWFN